MSDWQVKPARRPLAGTVKVPGDKSIGHRAQLLGALCDGPCTVTGLSTGEDNQATGRALEAMGARIDRQSDGVAVVHGVGLDGLRQPSGPLDCGNSGTSIRLLAGLLASRPFATTLAGDESLSRRPMRRVATPLERMGARVTGRPGSRPGELYPPLTIEGGALAGITYDSPVASAQVKSAVLLAGLYARGATEVREPGPSRDHTERMLAYLGAPISTPARGVSRVEPGAWDRRLRPLPLPVPGDPSSAAFLLAAALVVGTEEVLIEGVCINPTRTGFLDALAAMGARVEVRGLREQAGEPIADLAVTRLTRPLAGVELAGDLVVRAIDEVPVLSVVAARASGRTVVRDAAELRVKESDRVATTVRMLQAFGVEAHETPDGLVIEGVPDRPLTAADVDSEGDHRIAMAAAVAGLVADGETRVRDVGNVATSFPGFAARMADIGAEIE